MFTTENSEFTTDECETLNDACGRLLADRLDGDEDDRLRRDVEKSVSAAVNNAWVEGITADEIVAQVRGGH